MARPKPAHPALSEEVIELLTIVRENPFWQFDKDDIGKMMNLTSNAVAMMVRADDTPFSNDRARPERVAEFLAKKPGWKPSQER